MAPTVHIPPAPDTLRADAAEVAAARGVPVLDLVVPVHNEQRALEPSVRRLLDHLRRRFRYPFRITVADNASTDATPDIAARLADELPEVVSVRLGEKGRGRALRAVWAASDAPVLGYLDVDLSTDLGALGPLLAPLISGHSDLAIGSRLARGARVVRGPKREILSRGYNLLLRCTLGVRFSDAQCGFKAIRADVAGQLLPVVTDPAWFFDTELLVLAERCGLRIHEVPVDWTDDPDSRVHIASTVRDDLRGVLRMGTALATGRLPVRALAARLGRAPARAGAVNQLARFAVIGVLCTAAYLALFVALRAGMGAQPANLVALLVTAVANTAANRRFTFGVRGRGGAGRQQCEGLVVFALGLGLTSGALALIPATTRTGELAVLVGANLAATVLRFLLLRGWVFHPRRADS